MDKFLGEYEIRKNHFRIQMIPFSPQEWNSCQEDERIMSAWEASISPGR